MSTLSTTLSSTGMPLRRLTRRLERVFSSAGFRTRRSIVRNPAAMMQRRTATANSPARRLSRFRIASEVGAAAGVGAGYLSCSSTSAFGQGQRRRQRRGCSTNFLPKDQRVGTRRPYPVDALEHPPRSGHSRTHCFRTSRLRRWGQRLTRSTSCELLIRLAPHCDSPCVRRSSPRLPALAQRRAGLGQST